jgi:putative thioredoxin
MANTDSRWVIEATEANFNTEVVERSRQVPVLLDFTAGWCGPCQYLGPVLEKLADEYQGQFVLAKIDFDRNPQLAMQMGVQSIPAVFAIRDGQIVSHFIGALPEAQVREFLKTVLPSRTAVGLQQAQELLAQQPAEALRLLEELAAEQPDNEEVSALRAQALLRLGREAEARTCAEQVTEASTFHREAANVLAALRFRDQARELGGLEACRARLAQGGPEAHYALGICLAAAGRYEEALKELLAAAEADRSLATSKVREAMVNIFHLLGPGSDLAGEYRSRLASVLY